MGITVEGALDLAKSGLVPYLVGKRGEGKTSFIQRIKDHLKLSDDECITLNLSVMEAQDLSGLPKEIGGVMVYSRPYFFNRKLIFMDEVDRVSDRGIMAGLLSLMVDRSINGHKLDDDVLLFCAGNGTGEGYDTVEMDEAIKDRLIPIPFEYTLSEKLDYFKGKYPEHPFVEYLHEGGNGVAKSVFTKFSGRRVEAFIKTSGSKEACSYILDSTVAGAYTTYLGKKHFNVESFLNGNIKPTDLNAINSNLLIDDMANKYMTIKVDKAGAKRWSTFINNLDRDSFVRYAKGIGRYVTPNLPERNKELSELGFFEGHSDRLREVILNKSNGEKKKKVEFSDIDVGMATTSPARPNKATMNPSLPDLASIMVNKGISIIDDAIIDEFKNTIMGVGDDL